MLTLSHFHIEIITTINENKFKLSYLDKEEVDAECGEAAGQLDVLVLGVYLRGPHQALVLSKDLLFDVLHLHESKG